MNFSDFNEASYALKEYIAEQLTKVTSDEYPPQVEVTFEGSFNTCLVGKEVILKSNCEIRLTSPDLLMACGDYVTAFHDDPDSLKIAQEGITFVLERMFGDEDE